MFLLLGRLFMKRLVVSRHHRFHVGVEVPVKLLEELETVLQRAT